MKTVHRTKDITNQGTVEVYRQQEGAYGVVVRRRTLLGESRALAAILTAEELDALVESVLSEREMSA